MPPAKYPQLMDDLAPPVQAKIGRPTLATPEVEAAILDAIANGSFLTDVCRQDGMPSTRTVDRWAEEREPFRLALARARRVGAEGLVADGLRILDECDDSQAPPVTKAVGQANYRMKLAGYHDRDTYGERPPVVAVQVTTNVVTAFGKMIGKQQGE